MAGIERRALGARSGLEVTALGLGLWAVAGSEWGHTEEQGNLEAIEAALDAGVTFFDTADKYGDGLSEELLGRAMKGRREQFVVATKIGWIDFDWEARRSRYDTVEKVERDVEASLRRLQTDHVDLLQLHIDFDEPNTPVLMEAFRTLKDAGKILAWGVSTGEMARLAQLDADGDCDTLQVDFSILNRLPERDLLPYCEEHGIGVIVRGPLAMGLLTGKYDADATFAEDDFRREWQTDPEQHETFLADLDAVGRLEGVVPEGQTLAQLALRFAMDHPAVSTVIPGAKARAQAEANAAAGVMPPLTADERRGIDAVVPPGGGRRIWPA
jgi:aryl-alcohol dehydrogenase-like predicted oxidoreductase